MSPVSVSPMVLHCNHHEMKDICNNATWLYFRSFWTSNSTHSLFRKNITTITWPTNNHNLMSQPQKYANRQFFANSEFRCRPRPTRCSKHARVAVSTDLHSRFIRRLWLFDSLDIKRKAILLVPPITCRRTPCAQCLPIGVQFTDDKCV